MNIFAFVRWRVECSQPGCPWLQQCTLTTLEADSHLLTYYFCVQLFHQKPVEDWPMCDCLISFHSKGFPLDKAIQYAALRSPFIINNLDMQFDIQVYLQFLVQRVICFNLLSLPGATTLLTHNFV